MSLSNPQNDLSRFIVKYSKGFKCLSEHAYRLLLLCLLLALVFNILNFLQFCQKANCIYRNSQILSPSLAEEFLHYYS